jgi:hypothetical protein
MNHSVNPDEPNDGGHHGAPCGGMPIAGRERTQPIRSHNGEANGSKQDERADDQFRLSPVRPLCGRRAGFGWYYSAPGSRQCRRTIPTSAVRFEGEAALARRVWQAEHTAG